jgi:hypothetical protein
MLLKHFRIAACARDGALRSCFGMEGASGDGNFDGKELE